METAAVKTGINIKIKRRKTWLFTLAAFMLCVIAFALSGLFGDLTLRTYEVTCDKLPAGSSVRIALITDLHSHIYGEDQQPLIDMIKAQDPDIIALVGDIVDDEDPQIGANMFFEDVVSIAPVYYVSGNHEFWTDDCNGIKEMIRGYGITVLSNERRIISVNGVRLCLCGIDDPEVFKYTDDAELLELRDEDDLLKRFSDLDGSTVNILLAHRPERIDSYRQYDFDLVLSGHTHGGLVRIPVLSNGIFASRQGWLPKYTGGLYEFISGSPKTEGFRGSGDLKLIISRGLGFNRVPRIFNPPEVVIVDITGEKQ